MICRNHPSLKTIVPDVTETVLPRREIIKAIDSAALNQLVYVTAPYGCGKTLSVISWMREHKKNAAWLSLCPGDESPDTLWTLLAVSVLRFAGEHEKADSVLNGTYSDNNAFDFLGETLKQVSPKLKDLVLIVDDCAVLHNFGALHDLKNTICNMLGCWRVIFIGRGELPPVFNDLIMKKCLHQITLSDLSFTLEETAEYFQMNGHAVAKNDLIRIYEETDGWPAALNAILSAPHNGTLRYGFSARTVIVDYIETEIWNPLDEVTKSFLMKTSILDKLTPSICDSITGVEDSLPVLRELYASGLFLSKMEEYNSFCYHRVFKDFLLYKLKKAPDIDANSLYIKVGWWLYERNESISALLSFFKIKYISGINQAFKKVFPADIGMDKYVEVASCLTSLDVNTLKEYPEVAARIALLHFIMGNIEEMRRIYKTVLDWHNPGALSMSMESYADFTWEVGWMRYVNPDDFLFNEDFEKWVNVSDYAPHLIKNDRSRAAALRLPSAIRGIRDYSDDIASNIKYYETGIKTNSGFAKDKSDRFFADLVIAEIAYEQEDFSTTNRIIKEIMPELERRMYTELYFICIVLLVKMQRVLHNQKEVSTLTDRLGKQIEKNGHHFLLPNFHAFELRNHLANGKPGATSIFLDENEPYEYKPYYYLIYRHITLVRALLSERRYEESNLILGNLELLCRQYKRSMDLIEINILRAVTEYGLGQEESACEYVITALDAGRKCGFIRIFADDAAYLWPILNLLRKQDIDSYIDSVILSCKKEMQYVRAAYSDHEKRKPLTKVEMEIIRLLKLGLTYPEIAKDRGVKLHTVKTQMSSIYSKLDVGDKISAIVKAENLGLI